MLLVVLFFSIKGRIKGQLVVTICFFMFGCRNDQILPSLYHLYVVVMLSLCYQYMINMSSLLKTDYFCNQMSKTNYPAPNDDWFLGSSAWLFSREENREGHPLFMGKVDSSQNS